MPYKDFEKTQSFQAFVSTYDMDGFFSSLISVFDLSLWIKASYIPVTPNPLNTSTLNQLMPGISDYYGPGLPVDVFFEIQKIGDFGVKAKDSVLSGAT